MKHSEQLNELAKALAAFQAEVPPIPKNSVNPFFHSKYADFADTKAVADPIATKHGLTVSQWPSSNERGDSLCTMLLHESGQFIASEMQLHLAKKDPQGQGSALTYAKRYAYTAALGLATDEDDDGQAASQSQKSQQQQRNNSGAKRPQAARAAKNVDKTTGEVTDDVSLSDKVEYLPQEQRQKVSAFLQQKGYPSKVSDLTSGQANVVEAFVKPLWNEAKAGAPF
jgi:hypothetical protein